MGFDGKTKLKQADINKVDFVPAGAQQHSRISIFKSADDGDRGIVSKFLDTITKAVNKAVSGFNPVEEDEMDDDEPAENVAKAVMCETWDYMHAFGETMESIMKSDAPDKADLIQGAVEEFGAAVTSAIPNWVQGNTVMKIGKKISTERMESLKACMVQLANLIADAESEQAVQHEVGDGKVAQPADKTTKPSGDGQIDNPAGAEKGCNPAKKACKEKSEGRGKNMADINKSALPQDVQDYISELEVKVAKAAPVTEQEDVFKGLPEAVAKMLRETEAQNKAMAEQIAKMNDEQDTKVFIAKAADLTSHLGVKAEEFGPVLKSINAASPELAAKVESILKSANEAVAKGNLFNEVGANTGAAPTGISKSDAWSQIETLADGMVQKGESANKATAISEVLKSAEGKRLYAIYTGRING